MSDDSFDDIIDDGGFPDVYLLTHLFVCSRFADFSPRTLESPYHEPNLSEDSFIDRVSGERDETFPTSVVEASIKASVPTSIDLDYKIDTVTIVSGIDKRIHLARLCDASPHIFGVHSKGESPQCSDALLVIWLPLFIFLTSYRRLRSFATRESIEKRLQKWL
jgi:hypothetical protein